MPNTPVFPNDADGSRIRQIPVFPGEGLRTRRAVVLSTIGLDTQVPEQFGGPADGFWPVAAIEVSSDSALAWMKHQNCHDPYYGIGTLGDGCGNNRMDPRALFDNDTMSRFSVAFTQVRPFTDPAGASGLPGTNALMPTIDIQFRASIANSPGDVRWWGTLNNGSVLTYDGGNGFVGLTQEGILATRWEVWARVLASSNENPGAIALTVQMSVDRLVGDGANKYGNEVTAVTIPPPT